MLNYQSNPTFSATAFQINEVKLYSNLNDKNQFIDISNLISTLTIQESLLKNSISADISIIDAVSLIEAFKLNGNEKIEILITRKQLKGEEKEYSLKLHIAEINNYSRTKAGSHAYNLKCVSEHVYNNQYITLVSPFQGSYGKIIDNICKTNLKISKDKLDISGATGVGKGVFTRVKPLYAINWLLENCHDDGTPFFFYETIQGKIKLKSYKELLAQDVYAEYNNNPYTREDLSTQSDPIVAFNEELRKIRSLSSDFKISKLKSSSSGVYSSQAFNVDISNKVTDKSSFTLVENKNKQLNDKKSFSDNIKFMDRKINEMPDVKNYFISKNSLAFGNQSNYHNDFGQGNLEANSRLQNLNALTKEITIAGDFDLELGAKLDLNIQRVGADGYEYPKDQYISGNYLLLSKTHTFTSKGYFIKALLKKDSFIESVDKIVKINREKVSEE